MQATINCVNALKSFTLAKLEEESVQLVNLNVGVRGCLNTNFVLNSHQFHSRKF
jgi:hypothetical protein